MAATQAPRRPASGNLQKHTSGNPLQRLLLARFHRHIGRLTADALLAAPPADALRVVEVGCGEGFVLAGFPTEPQPMSELPGFAAYGETRLSRPPTHVTPGGTPPRPPAREAAASLESPPERVQSADAYRRNAGKLHTVGLDNRPEALRVAAIQAPRAGLALADALHLPLSTGAADVVLCLEVLEHLTDPWAALAELQRVAHGGSMIVSVPNQPWFALANLARGKNLRTWGDDTEHVNHWRGGTFLRLLSERATVRRVVHSFPWVIAVCNGGR